MSERTQGMSHSITRTMLGHAAEIATEHDTPAILICGGKIPDGDLLWFETQLKTIFLLRGRSEENEEDGRRYIIRVPNMPPERMSQARLGILLAVLRNLLGPRDEIVCVTGKADSRGLDTLSVLRVGDEFEVFLGANRRDWESSDVMPEVLQRVLDLATELAAEGREGNPIGALFVVGDLQNVVPKTHQMVLNPFHGYPPERRNILDRGRLGETVKEFSTIDGAFLVHGDGTIESVGAYVESSLLSERLPEGLGARHRAAAAITGVTNSIAVVLSQSTGNVTIFRKGRIIAVVPKPDRAHEDRI